MVNSHFIAVLFNHSFFLSSNFSLSSFFIRIISRLHSTYYRSFSHFIQNNLLLLFILYAIVFKLKRISIIFFFHTSFLSSRLLISQLIQINIYSSYRITSLLSHNSDSIHRVLYNELSYFFIIFQFHYSPLSVDYIINYDLNSLKKKKKIMYD